MKGFLKKKIKKILRSGEYYRSGGDAKQAIFLCGLSDLLTHLNGTTILVYNCQKTKLKSKCLLLL